MKTTQALQTYAGSSSLQRPRFSPGLLLEDDDLTAGVDYTRNLVSLLMRSLFGCGVVCGLGVNAGLTCNGCRLEITVDPGLALDCNGNPIQLKAQQTIEYDLSCGEVPTSIWVAVCHRERCCRPRDTSCVDADVSQSVPTRIVDGFEIQLYGEQPDCACSCEPPAQSTTTEANPCADPTAATTTAPAGAPATPPADQPTSLTVRVGDTLARCPCVSDHYNGVCDCECECSCVVIGRMDLPKNGNDNLAVPVNPDIVRRIRPLLRAYIDCFEKNGGGTSSTTTANSAKAGPAPRVARARTPRAAAPETGTT